MVTKFYFGRLFASTDVEACKARGPVGLRGRRTERHLRYVRKEAYYFAANLPQ
jgi:hypothetical protein